MVGGAIRTNTQNTSTGKAFEVFMLGDARQMAIYVQCDGAQKNIFDFVTVSLPKSDI